MSTAAVVRLTAPANCVECKTREACIEATLNETRLYFCGSQCAQKYHGVDAPIGSELFEQQSYSSEHFPRQEQVYARDLLGTANSDWRKLAIVNSALVADDNEDEDLETVGKLRVLQTAKSRIMGKGYVIAVMRDMLVTLYVDATCRNQGVEEARNHFAYEVAFFVQSQSVSKRYSEMRAFLEVVGKRFYLTKRGTAPLSLPKNTKIVPRAQACQLNKGRRAVSSKFGAQLVAAILYFNKQATKIRWGYDTVVPEEQLSAQMKTTVGDFQDLYRTSAAALLRLESTASGLTKAAGSVRTEVALLLARVFDYMWEQVPMSETGEHTKTSDHYTMIYRETQGQHLSQFSPAAAAAASAVADADVPAPPTRDA